MRLWIIGNGFDLHHKLMTRYLDYKAYLCQQHNPCKGEGGKIKREFLPREVCRNCCECNFKKTDCSVPKFNDLPRSELQEDLWRDLEEGCSINLDALLDALDRWEKKTALASLDGDLDFAEIFTGDDFHKWLKGVENGLSELSDSDKERIKVDSISAGSGDVFLNFNYTSTLQRFYGIPDSQILYVHGRVEDADCKIEDANKKEMEKNGVKILKAGRIIHSCIAFGSSDLTNEAIKAAVDRRVKSKHLSAEYADELCKKLVSLLELLGKDVQSRLKPVEKFVAEHCSDPSTLSEIVVAGHSLGRIDMPYLDYLAKKFRCLKWRFLFHSKEDIIKAFEFCARYELDGGCVPWDSSNGSILGGFPCKERGGVRCSGFSITWPNKY